ncbi:MAG TPA: S49 family peptidase, partial [Nitrospiraceae bacterium]|nr:S49 family peptidase [Nitrospiraceae bacterium]
DQLRIEDDSVVSGPNKLMGTLTKPMSPEHRKLLQELVDDSFKSFKKIVTNGRPKFKDDAAALDAVATGQIFTANQALEKGLVDQIGFIEAAIARAAELAHVSVNDVRCVKYSRPPSIFGGALGASSPLGSARGVDLTALFELATPRAYYLWTSLPAAIASGR